MGAESTRIYTLRGDITKLEGFEAVVNPSNPNLTANSKGVNGVIHQAAGPNLERACKELGRCEVGSAVITQGFDLPFPYVIHAVGPLYREGVGDDEVLVRTYQKCLEIAMNHGLRSLAFASISTGSPNCPVSHIAEKAVEAVDDFVRRHPDVFDKICWVLFNYKTKKDYDNALREKGYTCSQPEDEALSFETPIETPINTPIKTPFRETSPKTTSLKERPLKQTSFGKEKKAENIGGDTVKRGEDPPPVPGVVWEKGAPRLIGFYHESDSDYGCFSDWYQAPFDLAGRHFFTAEQYLMYQKVMAFRKYEMGEMILRSGEPGRAKRLGSTYFEEFDPVLWDKICFQVLKQGIKQKFRQNQDIQQILLGTGDAILAYRAEKDVRWGIALGDQDPAWSLVGNWNGRNWLGRILMEVRDELSLEINLFGKVLPYKDMRFAPPIPEWTFSPGELIRLPAYRLAVQTYLETLPDKKNNRDQSFRFSLVDMEAMMNMGGLLPIPGFFEMKQTLFESAVLRRPSLCSLLGF